jgi:MinD superfamily P-loop ATPase
MKEIVVLSGKGGTGKTSLTLALSGLGPTKVLADCDVDAADMHLVLYPEVKETHEFISGELAWIDPETCTECGECLSHCRFEAISPSFQVRPEVCEGCALCFHVCPAGAVQMQERHCGSWFKSMTRFGPLVHASLGIGEENSGKLVTTVRKEASAMAKETEAELVLVDGSPGIGCPVIASLTNADLALIVAEPTMSALSDLERIFELTKHFGIPAQVVVNKSDINDELVQRIESVCSEYSIPIIGRLGYDQAVTRAQIAGQTILEYDPDNLGRSIRDIWKNLEVSL